MPQFGRRPDRLGRGRPLEAGSRVVRSTADRARPPWPPRAFSPCRRD